MGHLYPLASSVDAALDAPAHAARTRYEADALAGEHCVLALETEWLELDDDTAAKAEAQARTGPGEGFVQRYENADGRPVLAVTYWKLAASSRPATRKPDQDGPALSATPAPMAASPPASAQGDHTDDLYFRGGRTRKRRRAPRTDPRQAITPPGRR